MALLIGINSGFVTNSSSMVYHVPREFFDHPQVKKFMEVYEISEGFVGENLWGRSTCGTLAMTKEQKQEVVRNFRQPGYEDFRHPAIDVESDEVVIVLGDEHNQIVNMLVHLINRTRSPTGDGWEDRLSGEDFNLLVVSPVSPSRVLTVVNQERRVVPIMHFSVTGCAEECRLVQFLHDGIPTRHPRRDRELLVS